MANLMNDCVRGKAVEAAEASGFQAVLRTDGSDEYIKNLMFRSPNNKHAVFIDKVTAMNTAGEPSYFMVVVHPEVFSDSLIDPTHGIEEHINHRTKQNLFSSSNYRGFPNCPGRNEPCGQCYRAQDISALRRLFAGLAAM
jgi:hypothetical protein